MPVPAFQELLLPLLQAVSDGKEHTLAECKTTIAESLCLTANDRTQLAPDGVHKVFDNRVEWAKFHLFRAKLVENTGYGRLRITQRGQYLVDIEPKRLSMRFLTVFPEYDPPKRRIFVSHAGDSLEYCAALVAKLRQSRFDVWFDEQNLQSGAITETIEQELASRDCFIVVLSPGAIVSQWVKQEYAAALDLLNQGSVKTFVPVLASSCAVPLLLKNFKIISEPGLQSIEVDKAAAAVIEAIQNTH